MLEDQLSSMPDEVKIVDCPGLSNWCQIQRINCIQIASGNKLTISNTWEKIMRGFDDLTSVEHLCFSNSWEPFQQRDSIPIIEELTIWGCTDISPPLLWYPPMLASIRSLVIKDCLGVRLLRDELLPSMLKSLVVDSCENLRCLQLVQQNRDVFEELQIVNCPKIAMVQGLNHPFFPKFLTIEQCPQLLLSQDDWRPFIHPRVQIAGVLETKFYPPHSEEIENKETIDDGTQEKQVSDWVKTEHANSIVSSIFDAADDCNMGQFLQLELPSGFYSQHPVHNNAEPLHADNSVASPISDDAIDCNMGQFLQLGFPSGCSSQSPIHNNAEPSN
ncbi:uncharacterized protein LOC113461903 [Phoenix dactylifera]|uniref:Uncharacterized protein LOC113461903 n=1 Tax=Phoenix dactylifera TaxID=42345 RepID=A0A8B8ZUC8_PHODC|nr:uncharacterized protein LOC113461903 [Phoenix dactylifera]